MLMKMLTMKMMIMLLDEDYGDEMMMMLTMKMMIMIDAFYVDDDYD
jgi:hypothetical protein